MKQINKTYRLSVVGVLAAIGFGGMSGYAQAGFEFYPSQTPSLQTPVQQQAGAIAPQPTQVPIQPLPETEMQPISQPGVFESAPLPSQQGVAPAGAPMAVQSSNLGSVPRSGRFEINPYPINKDKGVDGAGLLYGQPVPTTPDGPVPLFSQEPQSTSYDVSSTLAPVNSYDDAASEVVQGFGKNLPLALAVQQIIPSGYSYSFQKGVELSSSVTWEGGRSWQNVLTNTLMPLGYAFQVEGDNIVIGRSGTLPSRNVYVPPAPVESAPIVDQGVQEVFVPASRPRAMPVTTVAATTTFQVEGSEETKQTFVQDEVLPVISATAYKDVIKNWSAPRMSSLREILESWSQEVGVDLYWSAEYDYPIQTSINRTGTFEEVTRILLEGLKDSQPRPSARLHPNLPNGPAVLVVTARKALK